MRLVRPDGSTEHLSYCSNIHPAESWLQVRENLQKHLLPIKDKVNAQSKLACDNPFGIGLRLSAVATQELADPSAMQDFRQFLSDNNCYVFTINGFPYGPFHGTQVKEDVYLPDWMDGERLRYTNQIADVFAQFLPQGMTGSISTVPGAFKNRVSSPDEIATIASQMVRHVAHLYTLEQNTGATIVLALEPEPCCFLETIDESVEFFTRYLFAETSVKQLQSILSVDAETASSVLKKHLTLCFDLCHAAVEFENATDCLEKLKSSDISIGKVQISAGLRLTNVSSETISLLKPFDDNVYLHQVVESCDDKLTRYTDLPEAFKALNTNSANKAREWRVHFHVPIFIDNLGQYSSTQFFIREFLALHRQSPVSDHLEVETYTWNVLPPHCKTDHIDDAIIRELIWARDELMQKTPQEALASPALS